MASTNAVNCQKEIARPVANFPPSLWGDRFINYTSDTQLREEYSKAIEVLKNEVRNVLIASNSNLVGALSLVDTVERLGISYHFENEIEKILQLFVELRTNNYEDEAYDLYTVSLHFRVFRQHGYRMSSDIFGKFKDNEGKFQEGLKNDAKGLLSLYEAAHLRIHEEEILEDALSFATSNLKSIAPNLGSPLRQQVSHALVQPLHFGNPRIEARNFISLYEEDESRNEILLRFAKLDYNFLQMLHKEELHEISRWWKELGLISKLQYARDRVVECFFWAMGVYHQPQYSRARVTLTKTIVMTSIIDDTYDAYGTIEELDIFTEAIERWDISQIDRLPDYIKPFYEALLELYVQFEQELAGEGRSYAVCYAKKAVHFSVILNLNEFLNLTNDQWFIEGYLRPFNEYLNNALITCTYFYHATTSLLGTKFAMKEEFDWLSKKPKVLVGGLTICRVIDDIAYVEKERGQIATGIECYMKEFGVTKDEAVNKFSEIATNAWKDMNEECLSPSSISRDVLMIILNFACILDVAYKNNEDSYTRPEKVLKPHIIALVVDPVKI
ncbi:Germacrene-A synthase [Handroanthus impetiginosus]|uniref:Germacrene-A synthase n=1 Tax=Handroanthus impetiginosus TaxID=429701 RepID=A0A2G9G5X4_9LAMI|nr:Germacrene-A synthase [Handroanthus impetiginosus]